MKGASRQRKMEAFLKRMSPEGRALTGAFNTWLELLFELQNLRRAAAGFVNGSQKKAFSAWIDATFQVRIHDHPAQLHRCSTDGARAGG